MFRWAIDSLDRLLIQLQSLPFQYLFEVHKGILYQGYLLRGQRSLWRGIVLPTVSLIDFVTGTDGGDEVLCVVGLGGC